MTVIRAISGWRMRQPDYPDPAPPPRAILQAYPGLIKALDEPRNDALGVLTWPIILRNLERVVTAMSAAKTLTLSRQRSTATIQSPDCRTTCFSRTIGRAGL